MPEIVPQLWLNLGPTTFPPNFFTTYWSSTLLPRSRLEFIYTKKYLKKIIFFILFKMSKFVCGLSGEPVEEAVVSQVSGVVYEKRLIHKWIQVNSKKSIFSFFFANFQLLFRKMALIQWMTSSSILTSWLSWKLTVLSS